MTGRPAVPVGPSRSRLLVGLLLLASGCGEANPLLFPAPDRVEADAPLSQAGIAGEAVVVLPRIRVLDAHGNGAPGVEVQFVVTEGSGTVHPAAVLTDGIGRAAPTGWTLGGGVGHQRLEARVAGVPPTVFEVEAGPGAPAAIEPVRGHEQVARVGMEVSVAPSVRVVDAHGNGVPEIEVDFSVDEGELEVSTPVTDVDGVVGVDRWTLGTRSGVQVLTVHVDGTEGFLVSATADPGPAAAVEAAGPDEPSGEVGAPLENPPGVRVLDAHANPVPGVQVVFERTGGTGGLDGPVAVTDPRGEAFPGAWYMGTVPGTYGIRATVEGFPPLQLEATARPARPEILSAHTPVLQDGYVGLPVPEPPAVLARDRFGNAVTGARVAWGLDGGEGTVEPANGETGPEGTLAVDAWVLGPEEGLQSLVARLAGSPQTVTFNAYAYPAPRDGFHVDVRAVHVNQINQTLDGAVPLVPGRDGLLRVFVRANEPNGHAPRVAATLFRAGLAIGSWDLVGPGSGIPENPAPSDERSWDLRIPGGLIAPGLSIRVEVDPDSILPILDRSQLRFPADGTAHLLPVVALPPLQVHFIPIRQSETGLLGDVGAANVDDYLATARALLPAPEVVATVRAPYTTDLPALTASGTAGWGSLLGEIQAIRVAEGAEHTHYYGVVRVGHTEGIAGIGYVPQTPTSQHLSAVGWDRTESRAWVLAHELGHNMGRWHAPCGVSSAIDFNFPYSGAHLGNPGYDAAAGALLNPFAFRDIMSYCAPRWISDHNYGAIATWRIARHGLAPEVALARGGVGVSAGTRTGARAFGSAGPGLLVWGRVGASGVTLEPAFAVHAPPALPDRTGPHELVGFDADGRRIFQAAFEGTPVDHAADPDERHFAFVIPLGDVERDRLARIELRSPSGLAMRSSPEAAEPGPPVRRPGLRLTPEPDRVVLSWDGERYPMVLVRDRASGEILSFARRGSASVALPAGVGPALIAGERDRLELVFSDGVRSRVVTPD